eukprot:2086899-Amphidinium_carterae.1
MTDARMHARTRTIAYKAIRVATNTLQVSRMPYYEDLPCGHFLPFYTFQATHREHRSQSNI